MRPTLFGRRGFLAALLGGGFVVPRSQMAEARPCAVCGRPALWSESRDAETTSPTSEWRTFTRLGVVYFHEDGTRCERTFRTIVPA